MVNATEQEILVDPREDLSALLARANAVTLRAATVALRGYGLKPRPYSILALVLRSQRVSQRDSTLR